MKYYDLDKEEQTQLEEIESGKLKTVDGLEEAKREAVRAAIKKTFGLPASF